MNSLSFFLRMLSEKKDFFLSLKGQKEGGEVRKAMTQMKIRGSNERSLPAVYPVKQSERKKERDKLEIRYKKEEEKRDEEFYYTERERQI